MSSSRNVWFTPLLDVFKYQKAPDINDKPEPETKRTNEADPPPFLSHASSYGFTKSMILLHSSSSSTSPTLSTASNTPDVSSPLTLLSNTTASTGSTPSKTSKRIIYSIKELLQYRKLASSIPKEQFKKKEVLWTTWSPQQPPHVALVPSPSPRNSPTLSAPANGSAISTDPFKDAVFVALDFENADGIVHAGYGLSGHLKAQMGVCILDTRLLSRSSPALQSPESVLKTYNFSTCHSYCGRNTNFIFGQTQMTHVNMFALNLENLIDRNRPIVLIGHAISNELAVLRSLKFDLKTGVAGIFDTQAMMQRIFCYPSIRLSDLLQKFRMEFRGLHIAGNDANFTMRAFMLLMNQNAARAPVTEPAVRESILLLDKIARAKLPPVGQLPHLGPVLIAPTWNSLTSFPSRPIPIAPPSGLQFSLPVVPEGSALPLISIPVVSSKPLRPECPPFIPRKVNLESQATPLQAPANTRPSMKSTISLLDEPVPADVVKSLQSSFWPSPLKPQPAFTPIPSHFEPIPIPSNPAPTFKSIPSPFEPSSFGRAEHERPWRTALDLETKEARENIGFAEVQTYMSAWWNPAPQDPFGRLLAPVEKAFLGTRMDG
ncbi:hypothetical protein BDZ45DRAFT_759460 [Acephala macrosclerotiorum]|nr:hypothetical protein BDZ45DRAFT_759460 [Acephala macrosclerotiorum]